MQLDGDAARVEAEDATLEASEAMAETQAERWDVGMDAIDARFRAHPRRSMPSERSCECPLVPDALAGAARSRPERSELVGTPPGRSGRVNPWRWTFSVTKSWDPRKSKKSRSREFAS
jgi:hypothetical protein